MAHLSRPAARRRTRTSPRAVGAQLGLHRLDANWLADEDGISQHHRQPTRATAAAASSPTPTGRSSGTPTATTTRTSGASARMLLHCVRPARSGGDNALLDHELAYIALRDASPRWLRALMAPRRDDDSRRATTRPASRAPAQTGPVFSVDPRDGTLHMRYTARTRSIEWKADAATREAVAFLERYSTDDNAVRAAPALEPGMGIVGQQRAARPQRLRRCGVPRLPSPRLAVYRGRCSRGLLSAASAQTRRLRGAMGDRLARRATGGRAARRAPAARAGRRDRTERRPGLDRDAARALSADRARGVRHARARRAHPDEAFGRRVRERLLPSQEVLAQRLFRQSQELADVQRHLQRYHALVVELRERHARPAGAGGAATIAGAARTAAPAERRAGARAGHRIGRSAGRHGRHAQGGVGAGHAAPERAPVHRRGPRHVAAGRAACRPEAELRLRQRHLRHVQGARHLRARSPKAMPFDYPLSEAEKQQGYTLTCAHTAASSEVTLETLEAPGPADIPQQQIVSTVRAMRELAPDTRLLHLQTPRSHRLRFLAGQSVTLGRRVGATAGDDVHAHAIRSPVAPATIATCTSSSRATTATPSRAGCSTARSKAGDAVNLWGPMGDFVLADRTAAAGVRRLRHRLRADQEPDRTCAVARRGAVAVAVLAGHAPRRPLPWPTSAAPGPRRWTRSSTRCPRTPTRPPGARQMARAMRADLFDIDCDFYLAGPQRLRRHARREPCSPPACRRRRSRRGVREHAVRRSVPARCPDAGCSGGEVVRAARARRQHGARVRRGRDHHRRARRALRDGSFVLAPGATTNGLFRQLRRRGDGWCLHALNPAYRRPAAARPLRGARRHHPEGRARAAQPRQAATSESHNHALLRVQRAALRADRASWPSSTPSSEASAHAKALRAAPGRRRRGAIKVMFADKRAVGRRSAVPGARPGPSRRRLMRRRRRHERR